jgi:hypothetical protein
LANATAMCTSFKQELLNGSHAFGAQGANATRTVTTKDTFKAALYLTTGTRGAATTAYSVTDEVSGAGYSAGGVAITNATAPTTSGTTAFWTPSASIVYTTVTLTTAFDAVLIYNTASTGSLAVSVHTFGAQTITAGTFTLTMPVNDASNALIRIA